MELYESGLSADAVRSDPDTGLEESVWMLGLGSGGDVHYPERPGEQDCAHYLRTGTCGYGGKCHFNHPRDRGAVRLTGAGRTGPVEHRERVGQHVCEYYMRTGNCKFGSTCKYHHPRQGGGSVQPVSLNFCGYPLRPGEKECTYYMKTGQCKFGSTCKFHHPQSGGASMPSPAPAFYPMMQQISVPSPQQYPPYVSWQVARPSALPGSYMAGSYAPMLLSPGVIPVQGWNPYPAPVNSVVSPAGQQTVQARPIYGSQKLATSANAALPRPQTPSLSPTGPSITSHRENKLPERPGHPECQFYMRTGDCKFGATCKYHHPPYWSTPRMNVVVLNIVGLPLRPGAQPCTYYMQHGLCKFGQTCKFDHPMTTMSYSPSASSFSDMPVAPYPIGYSVATLAPSSQLWPEFISNKEHFSSRMPSDNR